MTESLGTHAAAVVVVVTGLCVWWGWVGVGWGRCPVHVQSPACTAAEVVVAAVTMLCSPVRPYVVVSHRSPAPPDAKVLFDHAAHHAPPPAAANNDKVS